MTTKLLLAFTGLIVWFTSSISAQKLVLEVDYSAEDKKLVFEIKNQTAEEIHLDEDELPWSEHSSFRFALIRCGERISCIDNEVPIGDIPPRIVTIEGGGSVHGDIYLPYAFPAIFPIANSAEPTMIVWFFTSPIDAHFAKDSYQGSFNVDSFD